MADLSGSTLFLVVHHTHALSCLTFLEMQPCHVTGNQMLPTSSPTQQHVRRGHHQFTRSYWDIVCSVHPHISAVGFVKRLFGRPHLFLRRPPHSIQPSTAYRATVTDLVPIVSNAWPRFLSPGPVFLRINVRLLCLRADSHLI